MWSATSNVLFRSGFFKKNVQLNNQGTRIRWPELETGANSVTPWTSPNTIACRTLVRSLLPRAKGTVPRRGRNQEGGRVAKSCWASTLHWSRDASHGAASTPSDHDGTSAPLARHRRSGSVARPGDRHRPGARTLFRGRADGFAGVPGPRRTADPPANRVARGRRRSAWPGHGVARHGHQDRRGRARGLRTRPDHPRESSQP